MIKLEDLRVKPKNARDYARPLWNEKDISEALLYAAWDLATNSYYAPYIDRYPIGEDEDISKKDMTDLIDNDTCAFTDGQKVYVSAKEGVKQFQEMMNRFGKTDNIGREMEALLSHEYTHILCEHHAIAEALVRKYGKNGRINSAIAECHTVACEIQANRGAKISHDSLVWKCGVTDEHYPETKGLYTYSEIFSALVRSYNDKKEQIKKAVEQVKDMFGDELKKMLDDQNGQGSGKGKEDGKEEGKGDGGSGFHIKGKKDKEAEEHFLSAEEIDDILNKAEEAEQEVYDELVEFGGGFGLDKKSDGTLELNPDKTAQTEFKRWDEERIKKEVKRMRGFVQGSLSRQREKTYARPARRAIDPSSKLLKKGVRNGKTLMPRVLVAMDSSGSMGGTPVTQVATAIGNIFKDLGRPMEGCYICKHESECSKPMPLSKWEEVVKSFRPSGGNCFNNVVELANSLGVDVVFNIGDGCDCCIRRWEDNIDKTCEEFKASGRVWVDTLIFDKKENGYFDSEWQYDEDNGFHREILELGSSIAKYL